MTKRELKAIKKFEHDVIVQIKEAYVDVMLEQVPQSDFENAKVPSKQKMYRLIKERIQLPLTMLIDGMLISFLNHKYDALKARNTK